ncbi:unnamed protein product [Cunninghamella echinulata]
MPPPPLKKQKRQQQYRIDFTKKLFSDEIILNIFSYLTATNLINCEKVNKTWYRLANDTFALWRPLYEEKFDKPLSHFKAKWAPRHCTSTQLNININLNINNTYNNNNTQRFIQYTHDILCFINHDGTKVEIWQLQNTQPTHIYTIMDHQLFQPQQHTITCLKLKKDNNNNKNKKNSFTLIVGTSHAQYMIWELIINKNECKPLLLCQKNNNYHHSCQEKDAIIAMDLCDNIITFCTESMKLEYYDISCQPPRLIYHLQSNVHWSPIILQLHRKKSTSSFNHHWCALLFFGMHIGLNASSIGVQEMILSKNTLISSRHCSILCQDQLFFTNRTTTATTSRVDPPMTSMIYSEPFLMTSHSNNTIKQYRFYHHDTTTPSSSPSIKKSNSTTNTTNDFRLSYVQTLFGHTSQVNYLAMDANQGRLVSGDRYGLKMWDLLSLDQCKVRGNDYMINIKYNDNDDDQQQHITTTHHMKWLQMDHDKIMGLLMDDHNRLPYFKIWSFDL